MPRNPARPSNHWPLLPIAIGIAFLGVSAWSIIQAREKVSPITDPAYYSHGLRYNQTTLEERAAESAGWLLHTDLAGHRLRLRLENGARQAVSGCRGELTIYQNAHSQPARRLQIAVREVAGGVYLLELPAEINGTLSADLSLHRDGARFNRRLLLNL